MKKKIKYLKKYNNVELKNIAFFSILMLIVFSPFLIEHYTSDSYTWLVSPFDSNPIFSQTGRQFSDFILAYTTRIGFNPIKFQLFHNIISIVILCVASIALYNSIKLVKKNIENREPLLIAGSFFTVFCIFLAELFIFNCMLSISFSILFVMLSINILIKELTPKNIIKALVLNLFVVTTYQTVMALYIGLAILIVGYKYRNEKPKEFILMLIKIIMIYVFSFIFELVLLNVFFTVKSIQITSLIDTIGYLLKSQYLVFIDTYGIFPRYSFLFFLLIGLFSCLYVVYKNKSDNKRSILILIFSAISIIGTSYLSVISGSGIMSRIIFPVSSLFGIFLIFIGLYENREKNNSKIDLIFVLKILMVFYLYIFAASNVTLMGEIKKYNKLNEFETKSVFNMIKSYEKESNITVKKILFGMDPSIKWYPTNYSMPDVFIRALYVSWSRLPIIEVFSDRTFEGDVMSVEKSKQYCKDNYDEFDEKQVFFDDYTMYLCIY